MLSSSELSPFRLLARSLVVQTKFVPSASSQDRDGLSQLRDKSAAHTTTTGLNSSFFIFARVQRDFLTFTRADVGVRVPKTVPAVARNEAVVRTVVQVAPALPESRPNPEGLAVVPHKVFSSLFEGETPLALRQFTPPKRDQSREPRMAFEAPRPLPPSHATRPSPAPLFRPPQPSHSLSVPSATSVPPFQ